MKYKKITEKFTLSARANNYKDNDDLNYKITLLDINKKELAVEEAEIIIKNKTAKYTFIPEGIAKSNNIKPEDVIYMKGWIDKDDDTKIGYNEEVIITFSEPKILDVFWLNEKDEKITLSQEDTNVKIKFTTENVQDGTKITGLIMNSKKASISLKGITSPIDEEKDNISIVVKNNEAILNYKLKNDIVEDDSGTVSKLYFKVNLEDNDNKTEEVELPIKKEDYLQVVERAVLISVFVEMPTKLTEDEIKASTNPNTINRYLDHVAQRANDLGLSGHAAISINEEYYDYGPSGAYYYSPGQPWWDSFAHGESKGSVNIKNISGKDYTTIKSYIENIAKSGAEIYEIKFLVTINQANILKTWWDNKYSNLGKYSVAGAIGSHCTNTVMESLYEAKIIGNGLEYFSYITEVAEPSEFYSKYMINIEHNAGFLINTDIPNDLSNIQKNAKPAIGKKAKVIRL